MDAATAAVLQDLAARVAQLERRPQASGEQLVPTYITVDATGKVGAAFTGVIHAQGATFDESAVGPQSSVGGANAAAWLDSGGKFRESLSGADGGHLHTLVIGAFPDSSAFSGNWAQIWMSAPETGFLAPGSAALQLKILGPGGTVNRTLLDDTGTSDFLQLLTTGAHKVAFGQANITWPGGGAAFSTTIAHGLGAVPVFATVPGSLKLGTYDAYAAIDPNLSTSTTFTVFFRSTGVVAAQTYPVYWLAIS